MATWPLKRSAGMLQFFVLLGLPLCHSEVASIPLAFTERVRDDTSLPLPLFLRRSRLLLPLSEGLRNLQPDFVIFWTVEEPVLFCAFLFVTSLTCTYIRPANIEQSLLRPTSSRKIFLATLPCFSVQFSFTFFRKRAKRWFEPYSLFRLFMLVFCCPLLPVSDRALCTSIFLTSFGHTYLMSIVISLLLKTIVCQYGHF